MKRIWLLAVVLAGCGPIDERREAYQAYYGSASDETESRNVERKTIQHWSMDLKSSKVIGFLEKYSVRLKGTREWRDVYYILNAGGTDRLGMINENGVFYRYNRQGRLDRVGEYPILDQGLRIFFGLPLSSNLLVADIDPYKE